MKVTKVCCQGCGATLRVDGSVRFVTCGCCDAQLEIVHDETTIHSKLIEEIDKKTDIISRKVERLELDSRIEQIDKAWKDYREKVSMRDNQGKLLEPEVGAASLPGILGIFVGLLLIGSGLIGSHPILCIPGLLFLPLSWLWTKNGRQKAEEFRVQRYRYQTARKRLLQKRDDLT